MKEAFGNMDIPSEGIVVLDFFATWCRPCKAFSPIVESVCDELDLQLLLIDIEVEEELTQQYNITSIPTLVILEDGEEVERFVGACSKDSLESKLGLYI